MNANDLQKHMLGTYVTLRYGVAAIGFALPLVLWLGGLWMGLGLEESMSAYYHAGDGVMRDWFVGLLFAVGMILHLYKGYSRQENVALNVGGVLAIVVALAPMSWPPGDSEPGLSVHGAAAVAFFLCIAYVCVFRAGDTLPLLDDPARERRYRTVYRVVGALMILSPAIALLLAVQLRSLAKFTFFAEAAGTWVFASYWLIKSREFRTTHAETIAIERGFVTPAA